MEKGRVKEDEKLRENGWYEIDILDLRIISYVKGNESSRSDVKEKFGISEEKSRSRLEKLYDRDLIEKKKVCRGCGELLSECSCGRFSKEIRYSENPDRDMLEMKFLMDDIEDIVNVPGD
jgi:hypothetical protein